VHMTRWIRTTPEPDLVTVWFGGNDWGDGMRGERFREVLRFTVDRIRRFTKGKSDILLMTNSPGLDGKNERGELGEAARAAAREKHTGLADVCAALASYGKEQETRNWLYVWDGHIGPLGHPLIAMTVFDAIAAGAAPD
jgi:lysophospholipase L1-like esterase